MNTIKERPINLTAQDVRAVIRGDKTQMRFIVGKQLQNYPICDKTGGGFIFAERRSQMRLTNGLAVNGWEDCSNVIACRHGMPGERLWVREMWRPKLFCGLEGDSFDGVRVTYADGKTKWFDDNEIDESWVCPAAAKTGNVPSIHMPRWASRITLEITDVRVERLNDISFDDVLAEGIEPASSVPYGDYQKDTIEEYRDQWNSRHGPDAWAKNPWVWVVTFARV